VELAAYFVIAEALTNVAKYAEASHARVHVERDNGRVVVKVSDDGVGGANPEEGTGLRGLADRLAVIEGRLSVDSERGRGTTVTARIPCA
jgi:signal transduction histidine kinase